MSFTVAEILGWTGGRLVNSSELGTALEAVRVSRPTPLSEARPGDLAFFFSKSYEKELPLADPGVLITGEPFVKPLLASGLPLLKRTAVIACADPYLAMGVLSERFAEALSTIAHVSPGRAESFVHPTAVIHASARIGKGVSIGPHCVIEAGAEVGDGCVLYPGCFVGPGCRLGSQCVLFPRVTLYEWTVLGRRVRIHAGAVLGSDGFGYAPRIENKVPVGHQKIYHLGRVVVGDDVEIGANVTVDRGTFGDTRIGSMAKLDNDVHVGHNSQLAEGAVLCGGTALAGRSSIGRFAYVGGLTGITNDVHVGDGAKVGALSLVTKDVEPGGTAVGNPQREYREHFKAHAMLSRLLEDKRKKRNE